MVTREQATQKVTWRSVLTDPHVGPITAIVFLLLMGFGLIVPVLPLFVRSFGVGYDGTGVFIAGYGLARLVGDLVGGGIVDRKGEGWTAIVGMGILAFSSTATALSPSYVIAVAFWSVAGFGSATVFAALFSFILKAAPPERMARTLSVFYGAFNIGIIVGGALGGFVAGIFGLAAPLVAYSCVLCVAILAYLRFVPDAPRTSRSAEPTVVAAAAQPATFEAPGPSRRVVRDLLRVPGFKTALFLSFTYLWVIGTIFNTLLSLFAKDELGMSTAAIGATFAVVAAVEFLVLFPAGSIADSRGRKPVMVPSLAGLVVTMAILGWSTSPAMLVTILAAMSVASGFAGVPPAAMLSDLVPSEHSGRATGAFRFCGDLAFFFGPLIAGAAAKAFGFETTFLITAAVPAMALLLMLRTAETLRRDDGPHDVPDHREQP